MKTTISIALVTMLSITFWWFVDEGHIIHNDRKKIMYDSLSNHEKKLAHSLYQKKCGGCHGADLKGGFGPPLLNVNNRYSLRKIEKIAKQGKGRKKPVSMPAGLVTTPEAKLLVRWLSTQSSVPLD